MILCCDDIGYKHRNQLSRLDDMKRGIPNLKLTAFVIANNLPLGFAEWHEERRSWIELAVHGWDHDYPPECERPDKEARLIGALAVLRPYLPDQYGFRAPGFQMTASTYPLLRKLGFTWVAHQARIQDLTYRKVRPGKVVNIHVYDLEYRLPFGEDMRFEWVSETLCAPIGNSV